MFKTHGVAQHLGIRDSRGMFCCLRTAIASCNGSTHGHVLLIFLGTILVVHVLVVRPQKPQGSASPRMLGSVTTSPFYKCTATRWRILAKAMATPRNKQNFVACAGRKLVYATPAHGCARN